MKRRESFAKQACEIPKKRGGGSLLMNGKGKRGVSLAINVTGV